MLTSCQDAFLFTPNLPFMKKPTRAAPFFGLNDKMPVVLALILGFQHSLAMLAGIITPPISKSPYRLLEVLKSIVVVASPAP